jgi:hypothetical protein
MPAIPSTGDIQFLSNASSVSQVFGLGAAPVSMSSLVGKKTKAAEIAFSSNTLVAPISLRSLAGLWPVIVTQIPPMPVVYDLDVQNPGGVQVEEPVNNDTPSLTWYYGIGTSPGTFDKMPLRERYQIGVWNGDIYTDTPYYISALYSNTTTGEKGVAISNTDSFYARLS